MPLGRTWRAGEQRAAVMEFCIQTAKQQEGRHVGVGVGQGGVSKEYWAKQAV